MSNQPDKEDIEDIQLFTACQMVEETLRRLNGRPAVVVRFGWDYVSIDSASWSDGFSRQNLFDALKLARETKPA